MLKLLALCACFTGYAASSQVESGTLIVIYLAQDKIAIAADSRSTPQLFSPFDNISPRDDRCKISTFGDQLIFASAGVDRNEGFPFWTNSGIVKGAFLGAGASVDLKRIAETWGETIASNWRLLYKMQPKQFLPIAGHSNGLLTTGFFALRTPGDISYVLIVVKFDKGAIKWGSAEIPDCNRDRHICGFGRTNILNEFLSETTPRARAEALTWRNSPDTKGIPFDTWRAMRLVELTELYEPSNTVGGEIDAAELRSDGVHWIARKENCPGSEDY